MQRLAKVNQAQFGNFNENRGAQKMALNQLFRPQ